MSSRNIVHLERLSFVDDGARESYQYQIAPQALSSAMGARKLGYNVSSLLPGQFSCPYHFHHSEEELLLVISGKAILRQPDGFQEVTRGDLAFFTNSAEGAHQLYNHGDEPFRYLAISTKDELEICEFPDSKKVSLHKLKKVFQGGAEVDYWKDEEDPARYWPKERLR